MSYRLQFKANDESAIDVVVIGSGETLVQALADLEGALILLCGVEAAFENHCCFLTRDITSMVDDLSEVGGEFECFDFSDPEGAFTITRLPS